MTIITEIGDIKRLKSLDKLCCYFGLIPGLLLYYKKQIGAMESNKAIIKVARKLLNRIRFILTMKVEDQCGRP